MIYESRLELARVLFADFDRSVHRICAQPFLLAKRSNGVERKHIPDYLLITDQGPKVVDVKPAHRLSNPDVEATFAWTRAALERRGWAYEVWSEPNEVELQNIRFLAGFRRPYLFDPSLLAALRSIDPDGSSIAEAIRTLTDWPAPLTRSALLHLLWSQRVRCRHKCAAAFVLDTDPKGSDMTTSAVRLGVGTRLIYDGEPADVVAMQPTKSGIDLTLRIGANGQRAVRIALRELLDGGRARIVGGDAGSDHSSDTASVVLAGLSDVEMEAVRTRAAHVREVLTGYRSGHTELAGDGEPRAQFDSHRPLMERYAAKADELGVTVRTIGQWVSDFRADGEAGLVPTREEKSAGPGTKVDPRWTETAIEVMVEHQNQSRPSQTMAIKRTNARVVARFGECVVELPSRATAFRVLAEFENRYPTFRVEHEAQPRHRRPTGRGVREATTDAAR